MLNVGTGPVVSLQRAANPPPGMANESRLGLIMSFASVLHHHTCALLSIIKSLLVIRGTVNASYI